MDDEEKITLLEQFFGRDPMKIPCFRTTFLYSVSSYFGVTLLTFLFTSRIRFSSHVGMGSFVSVTLGYFGYCRYQMINEKMNSEKLQQYLQHSAIMEGVETNDKKPSLEEA